VGEYKEVLEGIFRDFQTSRTLTREREEELERLAYAKVMLSSLPDELSEIVDRLTRSIGFLFFASISLLIFGYYPTTNLDTATALGLQIIIGTIAMFSLARYLTDGILRIGTLRKFEKKVNKIDRCETFEELYDLL